VTSANQSGNPPARTAAQARAALGSAIDAVVDGGDASKHLPSTIVTVEKDSLLILREGGITDQDLAIVWDEIGRTHR
jgi:tRNA A37 threonylcarbamoyladenosine synthetase subunit TsaC/SUA5/YrdC